MQFTDFRSVYEMLKYTVGRYAGQPAYRWILPDGSTDEVTWAEFLAQVQQAGKSLIALGVGKNDKACILSYTCYEWILADMALMSIGSVTVGIYQSNLAKDCRYIINHSDAVLVFAENEVQLAKLLSIRHELPKVRKVVLFKGTPPKDDWIISFAQFLELGAGVPDQAFQQRADQVKSSDPAGIVYTSGTTGVPKGAVLTNDNITFTAQSVYHSTDIHDGDVNMLFLPLAHIFARTCVYASLFFGSTTTCARSLDTIAEDFKIARPDWFPSVPRIYEKVHSKIISGAEAKGGLALKIFRWACAVGAEVSDLKQRKRPIPALTNFKYKIANKLVFSKVHAALGGRVRWCISGAAPLNPDIGRFFHAAGVLILEGIGMTENTSFTNVNRVDNYRFGWVGLPGPGIEQKVNPDGEILYRGRNVMKEYYKMPAETAETLTPDGWQHTGDLGEIDDEGFLRVTGRKKDLIVTAGGKNVAPAAIEGTVATSKYINQVCVIGDRQPYLTALVTLDLDNVAAFAREAGIVFDDPKQLQTNPKIVDLIQSVIQEKNQEFTSYETIKKFRIVDEFTIDNELLTPTLKVKRNVAMERFAPVIAEMYAGN
ncbi:MAG: long-chain fatty acid--CoA ligase [Holophagae bacterium]|nr:MAG: long-chain fatty acid--CoA ligase [Holophagae bacterium]